MSIDAWLPQGFKLAEHATNAGVLFSGNDWQIIRTRERGRALVVNGMLLQRWCSAGLVEGGTFAALKFGDRDLHSFTSNAKWILSPVSDCRSPDTKSEAMAFAAALKATRRADAECPLQDAVYVEELSRLLPTYSITSRTNDDVVLGYWLTGGAGISATSFRRLGQMMSWLGTDNLRDVVGAAGFAAASCGESAVQTPQEDNAGEREAASGNDASGATARGDLVQIGPFELPGRPELASFFNEHVVDIIQNRERYKALGVGFPSAVVLYGPPGCGKTFAVERLVDYLGWPSFEIDASSVASPYIHETSRKVAEVFDKAMENAPSVLVIDEMDAFLSDREGGTGQYRVEEVAEFLRRIPEATKNDVLIIAMTNRLDMIDSAVIRRGRFDHLIEVGYPSTEEVRSLLTKLLSNLPITSDVSLESLVSELAGRPLSDVTFVVREGARLAARAGLDKLDQQSLIAALQAAPAREREGQAKRSIGFI